MDTMPMPMDTMPMPMDTMPMPLDAVAAAHGGLDDFRITAPIELATMLKRLLDAGVVINLNAPNGTAVAATLWTVDAARGAITFSADAHAPQLQALIECNEAVAVAYLDSIKVQFDVQGLMLVHNGRSSAISCGYPREMFRFQRRNGYRVRPLLRNAPTAHLRHPMIPDMQLNLRVLDVSIGGCALFLPEDVPMIEPGVLLNGVELDLDVDTNITAPLRLQHVTSLHLDARGVRLGCELVNASNDNLRVLQRYIDQTQKRRRLMVLD
ncbi:MAG: flagellar brake protein [Burkholderiaceae bacterium]|nr:flagellar brake protein [Burkholderiaceae bacterium]